jgi:alpha-galactosidase
MRKITFIGAGSIVFARKFIIDILSIPELRESTICLMDIDKERLKYIHKLGMRIIEKNNFKTNIKATNDLKIALKDANYIISMIQVGGLEPYKLDIEIPLKYGVNQAVGDTLGPGGVFRGLRTIPVYLNLARNIEKLCPDALFINYANPMAINCWALNKATNLKNVGLCHSVQNTSKDLARYINMPYEQLNYRVAGINHMAWFLEINKKGEDLYPLIREKSLDPMIYKQDVTKFEFLKYFGYFVTESSMHMSEYVPYFRKSAEWNKKIHEIQKNKEKEAWTTSDESGVYLKVCQERESTFYKDVQQLIDEEDAKLSRSHEYGSNIIEAMETGRPLIIYGNVENNGHIKNLPTGCTVEVPCLVDKNGIQPTYVGSIPTQLASLNQTNINVQELTVEGALSGNKESIYQAVMMDPLTSAVLTLPEIYNLVTEMFEAEKQYLPQFN